MRKTRFSKVLALTLVFVMVMSSVASAATPVRKLSNTLTATFNVAAPVITVADVENLDELKTALGNTAIDTINITKSFSTAEKIVVGRPLTINGGNNTITFTSDIANWNSNYVMQVYNTLGVTISNIKLTGGDAGLLVNSSTVTLTGVIDVSGNEFGGIETAIGDGLLTSPLLTVTGVTLFTNITEAYGLPTIWEDGITNTVIQNGLTLITFIKSPDKTQEQYYIKVENSVDQVANAIAAVNGITDVTIREVFEQYSSVLGISDDIMIKFRELPVDQGRQKAVADAVIMLKPYNNKADIKLVFEGTVKKEYDKMMFINAVDGATTPSEMKAALDAQLDIIHANRQALIGQLKEMSPKYDTIVAVLEASTYTKVLAQVNSMSETALASLAEALYAKKVEVGGKFFGVVNITDAINSILQANPVVLSWNLGNGTIEAIVGQIKNATVTATLSPGVNSVTARLAIEVSNVEGIEVEDFKFISIEDNINSPGTPAEKAAWLNRTVSAETGKITFFWGPEEGTTINKQVITDTQFIFNKAGVYNINLYLIEGGLID